MTSCIGTSELKTPHRRYLIGLLTTLGLWLSFTAGVNYAVDPYGVFDSKILKIQPEYNQYFRKIDYLNAHYKDFNAYMMGASTIGFTPPALVQKFVPEAHFYNLWGSTITSYEMLEQLKYTHPN